MLVEGGDLELGIEVSEHSFVKLFYSPMHLLVLLLRGFVTIIGATSTVKLQGTSNGNLEGLDRNGAFIPDVQLIEASFDAIIEVIVKQLFDTVCHLLK